MIGLLVLLPVTFLAHYLALGWLYSLASWCLLMDQLVVLFFGVVCGAGMASGQYSHLEEREWKDQVW
jgi:hypothetical protein